MMLVEHVTAAMSTTVSVQIAEASADAHTRASAAAAWFPHVESICTRFADSELTRLARHVGSPVQVSPLLFELLQLAVAVASASDGAFDPTVGALMATMGFNTPWREDHTPPSTPSAPSIAVTWRDIVLDAHAHTVTLQQPLTLDLGAIAKGFAIDLAMRELRDVPHVCINAGGDLAVRGHNAKGQPWRTGIRHPIAHDRLCATVTIPTHGGDVAVCTSGDYLRTTACGHHLVNPQREQSATSMRSATVVAPNAAIADALSTAAFVLGPERGAALLREQQVDGLFFGSDGTVTVHQHGGLGTWAVYDA